MPHIGKLRIGHKIVDKKYHSTVACILDFDVTELSLT